MTKRRADDEALEWLVKLAAGPDAVSEAEFKRWKDASAENAAAHDRLTILWEELGSAQALDESLDLLPAPPKQSAPNQAPPPRRVVRNFLRKPAALAGLAAAACLGLAVFSAAFIAPTALDDAPLILVAGTAPIEAHELEDGSLITLGPETEVEIAFSDLTRTATLTSGAAYFDIAPDENRPFIVHAGDSTIRVLGTAFDVQRGAGSLRVSVNHGHVQVATADHKTEALSGGDQLLIRPGSIERGKINPESVASWMSGRLIYRQVPLDIITADLDRYLPDQEVIVSPEAGALRMTATFDTSGIHDALEAIALANGLELKERPNGDLEFSLPHAQ